MHCAHDLVLGMKMALQVKTNWMQLNGIILPAFYKRNQVLENFSLSWKFRGTDILSERNSRFRHFLLLHKLRTEKSAKKSSPVRKMSRKYTKCKAYKKFGVNKGVSKRRPEMETTTSDHDRRPDKIGLSSFYVPHRRAYFLCLFQQSKRNVKLKY